MGDEKRKGDWMQTFSGRVFWPLDPRPEEIFIDDIAHSLSNQCRYAGHCDPFYSVAEHSVRVAMYMLPDGPEAQLCGLLHDAAEAYLVDLPRPVKRHMCEYAPIEDQLEFMIRIRFNLRPDLNSSGLGLLIARRVKEADEILLATEARDLMKKPPRDWHLTEKPLPNPIVPWEPIEARQRFLAMFHELGGKEI